MRAVSARRRRLADNPRGAKSVRREALDGALNSATCMSSAVNVE